MKYLFKALFENGKVLEQNDSDISLINPQKSCFYDVLHEESNGNPVTLFELHGDSKTIGVNLLNGSFHVNGVNFSLYENPVDLKLIYFRRHICGLTNGKINSQGTSFHIGWQIKGTDIQRTITIE